MKTIKNRRDERGVALLLTIFGLLLLTAIVASMMFSSDSETKIATNYRDKQTAIYAAMSGVQEARDRLQPLSGDLSGFADVPGPGPTQLPGAPGQVLYIINPKNGETVAPWALNINGNPNPYFDKELCQEANMATAFGIAQGPAGIACTVIPAGKNWYAVYDDSKNATAWKLTDANGNAIPLDYKWIRVTLKADNSGLVYVAPTPAAANGTQVCWSNTPNEQLQLPAGSGTNCLGATTNSVACAAAGATPPCALTLNTGGTGYSLLSPPSVTFSGGGGNGATATSSVGAIAGGIASGTITTAGSNYTSPPTVSITNPGSGTGAVLNALVAGSPITGVSVSGGSNYCYSLGVTPASFGVNFTPSPSGTGSDASVNAVNLTGQACISAMTASTSCGSSHKNTTLTINGLSGGSGSGFSAQITTDNKGNFTGAATITNVGSYTAVPGTQTVSAGGCSIAVTPTGGKQIQSISLASGGSYITQPSANITGPNPLAPNPTKPALSAAWTKGANNGQLTAIQVATAGTGYTCASAGCYTLAFSGGGGSGAVANATASVTFGVTGITLTNAGAGYTSAPKVVIGGPGSGASATATLTGAQKLMLGEVYTLTALAVTQSGSQAMVQMEAGVTPPTAVKFQLGGALTINGSTPNFSTPNSANFVINGNDANSCGEVQGAALPAIGVADSAAQQCVVSGVTSVAGQTCTGLGKPNNYTGAQSSPDVQVTTGASQSAQALAQLVTDVQSEPNAVTVPASVGAFTPCTNAATCPTVSSLPAGGTTKSSITVINGNLNLSGAVSGNGILVVTGNMTISGNFSWNGLILVLGNANTTNNGGGNGQIVGAIFVGNTSGGTSSFTWNGGGGNGIQYDHCLADDLLNNLQPAPSSNPLQVLSTRTLEF